MTVNQRIKDIRKNLKMSQKEFASAISISNTYLAGIENEARKVNDRIIKLCSMVFGINETWLKEGKGEIFFRSPDVKTTRLVNIFNKLPVNFQDYALEQMEGLLKLREKNRKKGAWLNGNKFCFLTSLIARCSLFSVTHLRQSDPAVRCRYRTSA